jgi:hypothetical protein
MSLRKISAELAAQGHLTAKGRPYVASAVQARGGTAYGHFPAIRRRAEFTEVSPRPRSRSRCCSGSYCSPWRWFAHCIP